MGEVTEQENHLRHTQLEVSRSGDIPLREAPGNALPVGEASQRAARSSNTVTPPTADHADQPTGAVSSAVNATVAPSTRRQIFVVAFGGAAAIVIAVAAAYAVLPRSAPDISRPLSQVASSAEKFDPSVVPFLSDDVRRYLATYSSRRDFRALAISPGGIFGLAEGAPDAESAQREGFATMQRTHQV